MTKFTFSRNYGFNSALSLIEINQKKYNSSFINFIS